MGLFRRKEDLASRSQPPASTLGSRDVIPADSWSSRISAGGGALVDKATQVYQKNPKVVGGIALIASALALNALRGRPR